MKTIAIREDTKLTRFYNPVVLEADSGETISIAQRDGGFEIGFGDPPYVVFIKDGVLIINQRMNTKDISMSSKMAKTDNFIPLQDALMREA